MKIFSIIYFLFAFQFCGLAQIGIGTLTPAGCAALDLTSTSKGFLPPRMTKAQRDAIVSPTIGLIIYCTDCGYGEIHVKDPGGWSNMLGGPPSSLVIGENYGGGKVAYFLQSGDPGYIPGQMHGLIAAVIDQSTNIVWGCYGMNVPGAEGKAIGTGNQNTTDIVTGCNLPGMAAILCYDLVLGGYSDWYLPSKDELNKLYLNRIAIGGFANDSYWTSTEQLGYNAYAQNFITGVQGNINKSLMLCVRAVRSF